jgi:uncharacterized RDD family membrane protein YckC
MNDDLLKVETPERVELHFTIASIGTRFLACTIDHLIQMVASTAIVILMELESLQPGVRGVGRSGIDHRDLRDLLWLFHSL